MFTVDIIVACALFSLWFLMGIRDTDDRPLDWDEFYDRQPTK